MKLKLHVIIPEYPPEAVTVVASAVVDDDTVTDVEVMVVADDDVNNVEGSITGDEVRCIAQ